MSEITEAMNLPNWWAGNPNELKDKLLRELTAHLKPKHVTSMVRAIEYAEHCHQGQTRAGGEAYIVHPIRVCLSALCEGQISDATLLQAALLHDVIEAGETHSQEISRQIKDQFGKPTIRLVRVVSRRPQENRSERGDRYGDSYYQRIRNMGARAIVLKVFDKIDNLRDPSIIQFRQSVSFM